ncbi:MAG: SCO family protein [Bacteroidetes bacterium]|nr:MAG: SCO family protein [Bacteroidota bacterium]REK07616.1 MAG: SCO family protein [Bacteroidota bacterium]REK36952.1 MAG: SCO family protein [Bacteroidota bacterium]REK47772.1 MAG: SCO family protein [Bacteroidota bacterium]
MSLFKSVFFRFFVVGLITLGFMYWGYTIITSSHLSTKPLPVYGPKAEDGTSHKIGGFSFINQEGKTVTENDYQGKILIADFFFVKCEGICPIMTDQMERVYSEYRNNDLVRFLSHTVKPEEDSVEVLSEYAAKHGAEAGKWNFLTGDKKQLYEMARKDYMVSISEGDGSPDDFVHTQFFALVDPDRRIRGYYDGTDSTEVSKLIEDLQLLIREYR